MPTTGHTCRQCSSAFDISPEDLDLLEKLSPSFGGKKQAIPLPTLCPDCRQQRRLFWRNERTLYRRSCDLCKKSIIAIYPEHAAFPVYCTECWWSDKWNPLAFGRPFDFQKPFFSQFRALQLQVPRLALNVVSNENSEFVNLGGYNKNCYLVFAMEYNEDCLYGTELVKCIGCVDTFNCFESRYCYDVTDVEKCHGLSFSRDCSNCSESWFLSDCRGCSRCILCTNLRNKKNHVRNKEVPPAEFEREEKLLLERLGKGELPALREEFEKLDRAALHRCASLVNCENVTGDFLKNSRNLHHCFDLSYAEDCRYVLTGFKLKDVMDVCHATEGELAYEGLSIGYGSYNALFTHGSWTGKNLLYCDIAQTSQDLFGCVGARQNRNCILNKQYTKDEYETLVPKIIAHMRKTGEWGEFFPPEVAPFAYNETTNMQYFPLSEAETRKRGWAWREREESLPDVKKVIPAKKLPANIADVPDDILEWAIECEETKRPFKIVKQELDFYREHGLPIPHQHPDERHRRRMALRNPRKLWERKCANCHKPIATSYAPERPEKVLCEECYLKEVY
ncbi:MAG: hypothetical protein WCS85_01795 [Candidatus Peribacteraceae bacterium]|jgi:hypothetical protein